MLPDEMRELRAMTERVRAVFERSGYGEVYTPALEYEDSSRPEQGAATRPAYRMFDEQGNVLVLRSDMTLPIARLAGTRYPQVRTDEKRIPLAKSDSFPPIRSAGKGCYWRLAERH